MIADSLQNLIIEAMKAKNETRLSTLRMLKSAFNYEKIEKQHELTEEEELSVVSREVKKRKEAIEAYEKAGAEEKVKQETAELEILQEFLPEQLGDEELEKIVDDAIGQVKPNGMQDMGKVIGIIKLKVGSSAEGSRIAEHVKGKLV